MKKAYLSSFIYLRQLFRAAQFCTHLIYLQVYFVVARVRIDDLVTF